MPWPKVNHDNDDIRRHCDQYTNERAVNREYSTHIKAALYPIALRSVAEQIDALYWESGAPTQHTPYDDVIRKTDDLTDDRIISSLNEDMMTSDDVREKIARLKQLAERRTAVQAKLQKYRALQAELEFLKDPAISIQPHLGTRDGPLVQELTASRGLSTKLAGRIAGQKRPNTEALTSSRRSTEFLLSDQDRVKSVLLDSSMQDS